MEEHGRARNGRRDIGACTLNCLQSGRGVFALQSETHQIREALTIEETGLKFLSSADEYILYDV